MVNIEIKQGKSVEHQGIRVELVGKVDFPYNSSASYEFFTIHHDLEHMGVLTESKSYSFNFKNVDKTLETYWGVHVRLRYFIRLTIVRGYGSDIRSEKDFAVQNPSQIPEINNSIKMEVGIDDVLHLEFMWDKCKYHLKDVIRGKVFFLLVRLKVKHMELNILRKEISGQGANQTIDTEVVSKFEIMDGQPSKGECIPVRMYTSGFDITPTHNKILNKFSVRYYLNLILVDQEDRRYFKQQEITFWRKKIG